MRRCLRRLDLLALTTSRRAGDETSRPTNATEEAMTRSGPRLGRRTLIKSAGLGIGAGLVTGFAAPAQAAESAAAASGDMWSNEYWAQKGQVKLYMYRKRVGAPRAGEPPLPVLF